MYKGLKGKYHGKGSKVPMSNQTRVYETFTSIYRKRYKHMNRPNLVYRGNKPKEVIKKDIDFIFSPLQGFVLLWRKDLHWFERLCWLVALVASVLGGILLIIQLVYRFQSGSACVTTLHTTNYPIWNVAFPAVTLCNENKIYKPLVYKVVSQLKSLGISDDLAKAYLQELSSLITPRHIENITELLRVDDLLINKIGKSIGDLMYQLSQPCSAMLVSCKWLDKDVNCGKIFRAIKSVEGICCSFNYHQEYDSTINISTTDEEEVLKVGGSGPIMGLSVTLNSDPGNYYDSHTSSDGIKVIIHKPTTFADASISTHQIYPGHQLHLRLDAMIVRAEPNVKNLDIQQRQCYFSNEQNLAQEYTYQACVAECKMKAMMAKCGCLPFYYPNMFNARECSLKDVPCMKENNGLFTSLGPPNVEHKEFQCNCLSECCEILYEVYPQSRHNVHPDQNNTRDSSCIMYRRYVHLSWSSHIAALGGILALCMGGVSVFTLVELVIASVKKCQSLARNVKTTPPKRGTKRRVRFEEVKVRY
ncbi:hypothetical protein M8J77_009600 [Diaphorina citri]|nr:hypothetical protein M8J77_009600 [Diaphorina citri]